MKQLFTIIFLAALACSMQAQTSAVTVNSAGKIVVPANGTITSTGTITGNNITSNGTLTAGNITTSGAVGAKNITITRNGTASLLFSGDGFYGSSGNSSGGPFIDLYYNAADNRQLAIGDSAAQQSSTGAFLNIVTNSVACPLIGANKYNGDRSNIGFGFATEAFFFGYGNAAIAETGLPRATFRERVADNSVPIIRLTNSQSAGGTLDIYVDNTTGGKVRFVTSGANKSYSFDAPIILGASGTEISKILSASKTYDATSIAALATTTTTITVPGATTTNTPTVECTTSDETQYTGLIRMAAVTASNTVTVYLFNPTALAIDPGSITIRATVTGF